jgi:hypothetical protein
MDSSPSLRPFSPIRGGEGEFFNSLIEQDQQSGSVVGLIEEIVARYGNGVGHIPSGVPSRVLSERGQLLRNIGQIPLLFLRDHA